jgi:tRNA 2-thiouridine synthesizing protein E
MADTMNDILHPKSDEDKNVAFPHAPENWDETQADKIAIEEGLDLNDDHWVAIRFLQDYFATHETADARHVAKALDEKFVNKGGRKYLYQLFPNGPTHQGCRIAGLEPPEGSVDKSFGTVR